MVAMLADLEVVCDHCDEGSYPEDWIPDGEGNSRCPVCGAESEHGDDFADTISAVAADWAPANFHCSACESSWTFSEASEEDGPPDDGHWICPNCGAQNVDDGLAGE